MKHPPSDDIIRECILAGLSRKSEPMTIRPTDEELALLAMGRLVDIAATRREAVLAAVACDPVLATVVAELQQIFQADAAPRKTGFWVHLSAWSSTLAQMAAIVLIGVGLWIAVDSKPPTITQVVEPPNHPQTSPLVHQENADKSSTEEKPIMIQVAAADWRWTLLGVSGGVLAMGLVIRAAAKRRLRG